MSTKKRTRGQTKEQKIISFDKHPVEQVEQVKFTQFTDKGGQITIPLGHNLITKTIELMQQDNDKTLNEAFIDVFRKQGGQYMKTLLDQQVVNQITVFDIRINLLNSLYTKMTEL